MMEHEFNPGDIVEIVFVDMDGFTGRKLHPLPEMVGMRGDVIGWCYREDVDNHPMDDSDYVDFYIVRIAGIDQFWQLADFELYMRKPAIAESEPAKIGVAAPAQPKPKGDQQMNPQLEMMRKLMEMGYTLDALYEDNIVNMARDEIMVFVLPDGTVKPPRTSDTMTATNELQIAGIHLAPAPQPTTRYYADTHGDDSDGPYPFVFDRNDDDQVCCGPFEKWQAADENAARLNKDSLDPDGLRPHQVQHALDQTREPNFTLTKIPHTLAATIREALELGSNDAEHEALAQVAEYHGITGFDDQENNF